MKIIITVDSVSDLIQLVKLIESLFNSKEGEILKEQTKILKEVEINLKDAVANVKLGE